MREAVEFFQYVVANDPKWDFRTLDFDREVARAEKAASQVIDAIDPNLQPFFARGGKVLMYHGWNDQLVAPMNSVNYYQAVVGATKAIGGVDSPVHDARDDSLPRRRRPGQLRQDGRDRAMG